MMLDIGTEGLRPADTSTRHTEDSVTAEGPRDEDGRLHGKGKERWPDGTDYEGGYSHGMKHGEGCFRWPDGGSYTGQFKDDFMHGQGVYRFADGRVYTGQVANGRMEGHGTFEWPDGRIYKGAYRDDKKEGFGMFRWTDGRCHRGMWQSGKQSGEGVFTTVQGESRRGVWQEGKLVKWTSDPFDDPNPPSIEEVVSIQVIAPHTPPPHNEIILEEQLPSPASPNSEEPTQDHPEAAPTGQETAKPRLSEDEHRNGVDRSADAQNDEGVGEGEGGRGRKKKRVPQAKCCQACVIA
ncbi:unnamed protein product [Vitrella brassicaformis CCMP3155]|uniref:MORN repeat-containing protein 5 n=1 Tax=Vitrella brassicaformis (strain CCMP3155) TaxID=1169540 RepID=A0A0G4F1C8_VITBC|nr:unnamed protein product [Vitrella brassicaformis CCMP3155]|eukprot:CEM05185.1 unnamed protein product [Vitrella brassicaformis CCMP3155]